MNVIEKLFEKSAQWKRPLDRIGWDGSFANWFQHLRFDLESQVFLYWDYQQVILKGRFFVWCECNLHWLKNQPINYANYKQSLVGCLFISGTAYRLHNTIGILLVCHIGSAFISTIIYNPEPHHHFVAFPTWNRLKPVSVLRHAHGVNH